MRALPIIDAAARDDRFDNNFSWRRIMRMQQR